MKFGNWILENTTDENQVKDRYEAYKKSYKTYEEAKKKHDELKSGLSASFDRGPSSALLFTNSIKALEKLMNELKKR